VGPVDAQRIAELTAALVALPSHETEGEVQSFLAERLDAAGFACTLQEVAPGRANLIAVRGEGGPFICSHADTHPPHNHADPTTCRRSGDVLIGRGVLDAKGQIAALVAAAEAQPQAPATVVICCDEEFGGLGSQHVELPEDVDREQGGIVLEPTELRVCTAQSGAIDVRLEANLTPGHAYAEPGSAIDVVLEAIEALRGSPALRARHPLVPAPRLHVGTIAGGEHLWRRGRRAEVEAAVGLVPGVDATDAAEDVRARLDTVAAAWKHRGSVIYDVLDVSEPIEVPSSLPIVDRLAAALGRPVEPAGMPSWTDAGNLLIHHSLPCVVFGAGALETAHSDREMVSLADLVRLGDVLARLLAG
jgi:acetylornithine deacetylase/succinyl-diaminopimelate desuccinylase-like protein